MICGAHFGERKTQPESRFVLDEDLRIYSVDRHQNNAVAHALGNQYLVRFLHRGGEYVCG